MLRILEVSRSARPLWKSACWSVPVEPSHLLCINIHRRPLQLEVSSLPLSGCKDCSQHGSVAGISSWQRWPGKPPQISQLHDYCRWSDSVASECNANYEVNFRASSSSQLENRSVGEEFFKDKSKSFQSNRIQLEKIYLTLPPIYDKNQLSRSRQAHIDLRGLNNKKTYLFFYAK